VMKPFIWAMRPGTADSIWSTDTTAPGADAGGMVMAFGGALVLHALRVALPYKHAAHFGMGHLDSLTGKSPCVASCWILLNGRWPSR
jgi:hypothetical protein